MTPLERLEWLVGLACDRDLNENAVRMAIVVADRTHVKNGIAFISQAAVAAELSVDPRTIRRAGKALEAAGWVLVAPGRGRGKATEYAPVQMRAMVDKRGQPSVPLTPTSEDDKRGHPAVLFSSMQKGTEKGTEKGTAGCPPTGVTGGRSKPNNPPVSGFRLGSEPSPARARTRDPLAETLQAELEQKRAALGLNGGSAPRSVAAVVGGALAAVEAETGKKQTG